MLRNTLIHKHSLIQTSTTQIYYQFHALKNQILPNEMEDIYKLLLEFQQNPIC